MNLKIRNARKSLVWKIIIVLEIVVLKIKNHLFKIEICKLSLDNQLRIKREALYRGSAPMSSVAAHPQR